MKTAFVAWLTIFLLCGSVQAADKIIRIGFPDLAAQFVPYLWVRSGASLKRKGFKESLFE